MKILGINETSHDAAVSLIENGKILFAGHAERYSKEKNDWYINFTINISICACRNGVIKKIFNSKFKNNFRISYFVSLRMKIWN